MKKIVWTAGIVGLFFVACDDAPHYPEPSGTFPDSLSVTKNNCLINACGYSVTDNQYFFRDFIIDNGDQKASVFRKII